MGNVHTIDDLRQLQALPLNLKIMHTKQRIREFIREYGENGVYVSFSGGKDSTVLLHIVREEYPNVRACFVNTGLEYPEIVQFVKSFENVDIVRPDMNFKQVINKYGYPFISKEVSEAVEGGKKYLQELEKRSIIVDRQTDRQTDRQIKNACFIADFIGIERRKGESRIYEDLKKGVIPKETLPYLEGAEVKSPCRYKIITGQLEHKEKGVLTGEISRRYDKSRYKFMLYAPFNISAKCCNVMKKRPAKEYQKKTGRNPLIATMAEESMLRTQQWLKRGCNAFEGKYPRSNPLSFWTNNDILEYIAINKIQIASVYGDVVIDYEAEGQLQGQISLDDLGYTSGRHIYKTTGCKRTGCMFCGYGCHLEKAGEGRFELMKKTHPKLYDYIMRPADQGGLNYQEVINWINENGDLHIRY